MQPAEPHLEWISRASVSVTMPEVIGRVAMGERRVVRILSGTFEGRINGKIQPGASDFQIVAPDGTSYLDARYVIRTNDDALILVHNVGIRHGVIGDDPSKYYFRSTPRFETGDPRYSWLNKIVAVCSGARAPEAVFLDFYEVR